jgi:hypothetical protein
MSWLTDADSRHLGWVINMMVIFVVVSTLFAVAISILYLVDRNNLFEHECSTVCPSVTPLSETVNDLTVINALFMPGNASIDSTTITFPQNVKLSSVSSTVNQTPIDFSDPIVFNDIVDTVGTVRTLGTGTISATVTTNNIGIFLNGNGTIFVTELAIGDTIELQTAPSQLRTVISINGNLQVQVDTTPFPVPANTSFFILKPLARFYGDENAVNATQAGITVAARPGEGPNSLTIGHGAGRETLTVFGNIGAQSDGNTDVKAYSYSTTAPEASFTGYAARGTTANPTPVQTGDTLAKFAGVGQPGATLPFGSSPTYMAHEAAENWSTGAQGSRTSFYVTDTGTTAPTKRFEINQDGANITPLTTVTGGLFVAGTRVVGPQAPALTSYMNNTGGTISGTDEYVATPDMPTNNNFSTMLNQINEIALVLQGHGLVA